MTTKASAEELMSLLTDIIADLDLRARSNGDVEDGKAVLDLSNGLVQRYYDMKKRATAASCAKVPSFIVREAERAIHEATHPSGMRTNGPAMARIEASKLAALLRYATAAHPTAKESSAVDTPEVQAPGFSSGGNAISSGGKAEHQADAGRQIADMELTAWLQEFVRMYQGTLRNYYCDGKPVGHWIVERVMARTTSPSAVATDPPAAQQLSEREACNLAVIEHLGPSALSGGKMSILEAFEKGWSACLIWQRLQSSSRW